MVRKPFRELSRIEAYVIDIFSYAGKDEMRAEEIAKEILKRYNISRATFYRNLPKLCDNILIKDERGYKKTYYTLAQAALDRKSVQRSLFSTLSMHLFNDLMEKATKGDVSDEEFTELFIRKIGILALYTFLTGLSLAEDDPKEAGKWLEEGFGTLIQKDGWRICLNRQIFHGPVDLKHPIELKQPFKPEFTIKEGKIYVKHPLAFEPGLSEKVLRVMPKIPKKRIEELKSSIRKLYPMEAQLLNKIMEEIQEAAKLSGDE